MTGREGNRRISLRFSDRPFCPEMGYPVPPAPRRTPGGPKKAVEKNGGASGVLGKWLNSQSVAKHTAALMC